MASNHSKETAARRLFKQVSSVVEDSFLDENTSGLPHQALLVPSSSFGGSFGASFRGSVRGSLRSGTRSPAPSPRFSRSPRVSKSPAGSLRVSKPLTEDQEVLGDDDFPTEKEYNPLVSFIVVYTMIFFNGCCFTAVVPSVPFYLQELGAPPSFLGWVVSFYSLGQIIGSPTAGWLTARMPSKQLLTISSTLGLLSSALYAVAPMYFFVLLSRLLTGISAGMEFATELTFIAKNTTQKERTTYLATVTAVNVLGFIMGPALGTLLALLNMNIFGYVVDQYNGPGWLLAAMFLVDLFLVRFLFEDSELPEELVQELPVAVEDGESKALETEKVELLAKKQEGNGATSSYGATDASQEEVMLDEDNGEGPPSLPLVLSLIFVQFTVMSGFSVLETITSPLANEYFGWDVLQCNLLFTAGGFVSLLAYVIFVVASKWVQDRWLVVYALVLCTIGFMLAIAWQQLGWVPEWMNSFLPSYLHRFVAGYFVMNAGFMTGRPVTFALYSKLIASKYQGTYLGFMVAGGSAARTLGPFAAVALYYGIEQTGVNLLALFGTVALFHLACLVLVCIQWSRLLPGQTKD